MRVKIGVFGHFGFGQTKLNGQTIKTLSVAHMLKKEFGEENVILKDTSGGMFKIFRMIKDACHLQKQCEKKVLLLAQNGIRVLVPVVYMLNGLSGKHTHFVVIGGWLAAFLKKRRTLAKMLKCFDGIYAETESMVKKLSDMGFENVYLMPNFKPFEEKVCTVKKDVSNPVKLCTFSRVMQEKGIEEAVKGVKLANEHGKLSYRLTVFGMVEKKFEEKFECLKREYGDTFSYGGEVAYDKSVQTLLSYDAMLFPTYYDGEGLAGTLIDAFYAALPVIATDFNCNNNYVLHGENGILIQPESAVAVKEAILDLFEKEDVSAFRAKSLCMAERFLPEDAVRSLIENLR